jgi:hypothetical protein
VFKKLGVFKFIYQQSLENHKNNKLYKDGIIMARFNAISESGKEISL